MLDDKIKTVFSEESVYKSPDKYGVFAGYIIPSFVKDWLIKRFTDENDEIDEYNLKRFINNNLATNKKHIKGTLITDNKEVILLARINVEPDVKTGKLKNESIYNLQGQRVSCLQKGLMIVNGKKVYVK